MRKALWVLGSAVAMLGCGPAERDDSLAAKKLALAVPGPWVIPTETLAAGDTQYVDYTGAGPWLGEDESCSGGITPGAVILRDYLYAHFPQAYSIGGYSCRHINGDPTTTSVHATGRALDVMIHTLDGAADNDLGDPIGNWLIENAESIGIQYIIWDEYTWMAARAPGKKGKDYGGAHPHNDHLHVELSQERSTDTTDWFSNLVTPPGISGCVELGPDGGLIEETDPCFVALGPAEYWRVAADAGHGGSLLWTNAFENDEPGNWARWNFVLSEAGDYTVEVYVDPAYGLHRETRYTLRHAGEDSTLLVDQSAASGWVSLGVFAFEPGGDQSLSVYDNVAGPVADDQHIVADAVRVTRLGADPVEPWEPNDPIQPSDPKQPSSSGGGVSAGASGSCTLAAPSSGDAGLGWGLVLLGVLAGRRRSSRASE